MGTRVRRAAAGTALVLAGATAGLVTTADAIKDTPSRGYVVQNAAGTATVNAIARDGDTVFLGGNFDQIAPATGPLVGLSKDADHKLDAKLPVFTGGTVASVVPDGSGGFFVGGTFDKAAGADRSGLAHVLPDGSLDPNFKPAVTGGVTTMALSTDGKTLYIAGGFTDKVAAFQTSDGSRTAWKPTALPGTVQTMLATADGVYLGGSTGLTEVTLTDGAVDPTFIPDPKFAGSVQALAAGTDVKSGADTTIIYVGGAIGASDTNVIEIGPHGGVDADFGVTTDGAVDSLAVVPATDPADEVVYVGGAFTTVNSDPGAHLVAVHGAASADNSKVIADFDPTVTGEVDALAVDGTTIYAGGADAKAFDTANGDATGWDPKPNGEVDALAIAGDDVVAGGSFKTVNPLDRKNLAAVDAKTGVPTDWASSTEGPVNALAITGGKVYAGGAFTKANGKLRAALAAFDEKTGALDGNWQPEAEGGAVNALAANDSTVYAGGAFTKVDGQSRNHLAAIDPTSGAATSFNPDVTGTSVNALLLDGKTLYAGGDFTKVGGEPRADLAGIATDTGKATALVADPALPDPGVVNALELSGTTLYAGGTGLSAIDTTKDKTNATPVTTTAGTVSALDTVGSTLLVGGDKGAQQISLVDNTKATAWNPGLAGGTVKALDVTPTQALVGGHFTITDTPIANYAAFDLQLPVSTTAPIVVGGDEVGQARGCSDGKWTNSPTITKQWMRDGKPIAGATGFSYTLTAADVGHQVACAVTATNQDGSATVSSGAVTVKAASSGEQKTGSNSGGGSNTGGNNNNDNGGGARQPVGDPPTATVASTGSIRRFVTALTVDCPVNCLGIIEFKGRGGHRLAQKPFLLKGKWPVHVRLNTRGRKLFVRHGGRLVARVQVGIVDVNGHLVASKGVTALTGQVTRFEQRKYGRKHHRRARAHRARHHHRHGRR